MKPHLILLLFLLVVTTAEGQSDQQLIVSGTVTEQNGDPLPFANVSYANNLRGTVCNSLGEFKLLIPRRYQSGELTFSFIGYEPVIVPVSKIAGALHVKLRESSLALKEAVVEGFTGRYLIKKAIEKIPENYQGFPYINTGFYRLTTWDGEKYVHLSEAVFDMYYPETPSNQQDFRLTKMRAIKDENAARGFIVGQSPESIWNNDIINNRKDSDLLSKKGLSRHDFQLIGLVKYQGIPAYKITFRPREGVEKGGMSGHLLLDKSTLAFLLIDSEMSEEYLRKIKMGNLATRAILGLMGIDLKLRSMREQIVYKRSGDHYFLGNVVRNSTMNVSSQRDNYNFILSSRMDYVVTATDPDHPKPFKKSETLGENKMIETQDIAYDSTFWEGHTIILPDQDFASIAAGIIRRNKEHDDKQAIMDVIFKYPKDKSVRIDSIMNYYYRKGKFTGNALVTYQGEVIYDKSFNDSLTNHTQQTRFRIGSTTKTFTSALIMLLARSEDLSLSDPISRFLPEYVHGQVTIEQLLTHTSGIPDYINDGMYFDKITSKPYSKSEIIRLFCSDSLEFQPGSKFDYSNSGYLILAAIIGQVTGIKYQEALKTMILDPLKMDDTFAGEAQDRQHLATGFLYGAEETQYPVENVIGAGGITTTITDLLKWSESLDNNTLLTSEEKEKLWKPRAGYRDWQADYGYGWMIDKGLFDVSGKHQVVYHPGTDMGFHTMFAKQPDKGITIILLNNTGAFPRFDITDLILRELDR